MKTGHATSLHPRATLLLRLLLSVLCILVIGCAHAPRASRVVAVGDVHGAFDAFSAILQKTGLIDESLQWVGGDAILVQLGDFTDRGPEVRRVMDLLMALEGQAKEQGGKVVTLMGNHESYNLIGHFDRHSTPLPVFTRICSRFADGDSENRREEAYRQYEAWKTRFPQCASGTQGEWMESHPLGFLEYQEALSSTGTYGRWLRSLPVVARLDNTLFVHGGLSPELSQTPLAGVGSMNRRVKSEIDSFDRLKQELIEAETILPFSTLKEIRCALDQLLGEQQKDLQATGSVHNQERLRKSQEALPNGSTWIQLHGDGPLWFRGYATWSEQEGDALVKDLLETWDVQRIVVGHTPVPSGRIRGRFKNRILLIDTAMVYGKSQGVDGRPSALVIRNGNVTALYLDGSNLIAETAF